MAYRLVVTLVATTVLFLVAISLTESFPVLTAVARREILPTNLLPGPSLSAYMGDAHLAFLFPEDMSRFQWIY